MFNFLPNSRKLFLFFPLKLFSNFSCWTKIDVVMLAKHTQIIVSCWDFFYISHQNHLTTGQIFIINFPPAKKFSSFFYDNIALVLDNKIRGWKNYILNAHTHSIQCERGKRVWHVYVTLLESDLLVNIFSWTLNDEQERKRISTSFQYKFTK